MPATAGRVRMPANNRVHSSAALQTHGIWQSAIGYDPYAPDHKAPADDNTTIGNNNNTIPSDQNAYDSFQGLLALARLTSSTADEARGSCKKCGRVGHLTFQCRNFVTSKEEGRASSSLAAPKDGRALKKDKVFDSELDNSSDSDSESSHDALNSDSSDVDVNSDMERAVKEKFGTRYATLLKRRTEKSGKCATRKKNKRAEKLSSSKRSKSKRRKKHSSSSSEDEDGSKSEDRKKSKKKCSRHSKRKERGKKHRISSAVNSSDEGQRKRKRSDEPSLRGLKRHSKHSHHKHV